MSKSTGVLGVAVAAAVTLGASAAFAQAPLTVWWNKGFYAGEDNALREVVARYEAKTGTKVELSLFSVEDSITKAVSAVEARTPPDVGFGAVYDFQVTGKWAFDGKLEDVSDIVNPIKDRLLPIAYDGVNLLNNVAKKRSVYAVPILAQTMHTFYWADMLEDAGFKESDIPKDWNAYWSFWCDKVQTNLRKKGQRIYGIGMPTSASASDTYFTYLTFLLNYNTNVVDANGKLTVDDPKVRAGVIAAMKDYVSVMERGCTPPSSINWLDVDNNNNFHNKTTVMTPNASLSIPGKWLDEKNDENYYKKIRTAPFPNKPSGGAPEYFAAVKTAVIFADSKNKAAAKAFLSFLMQPENLNPYVDGSQGRWFPVTKDGADRPFWTSGEDPHRKVAYEQFTKSKVSPFQFVQNYGFTLVNAENLWGKAMARVTKDKVSVEVAVDEMFVRMKQLVPNPS